jgi:hypothetical protein
MSQPALDAKRYGGTNYLRLAATENTGYDLIHPCTRHSVGRVEQK